MAEAEIERLREIYEHWSRGDFRVGEDMFAKDVLTTTFDADGDDIVLHGLGPFQRWFRSFLEQWDAYRIEGIEFTDHGDRIFVISDQYATGKASGVELKMPVYAVWVFRDGEVVEFHTTRHETAALAKLNAR